MQCLTTLLYQVLDSALSCHSYVIIETNQCQHTSGEDMSSRIDRHFLKKDTIFAHLGTHSAIENIQLKCTYSRVSRLQKSLILRQQICAHKNGECAALRRRRQPGTKSVKIWPSYRDRPRSNPVGKVDLLSQ